MPSTVVHVAFALLLAAGLLGRDLDRRAAAAVAAATVVPDLDVFAGLLVDGTHRAALHTLLVPLAVAAALYVDAHRGERSRVRERYGARGVRVAWAALAGYVVAGVGLDLFTAVGVNLAYPIHDQFYSIVGEARVVGWHFEQTFVEFVPAASGDGSVTVSAGQRGSTNDVHVASGVDPVRGENPPDVERRFPVVRSGWQLTLVLAAGVTLAARRRLDARYGAE